MLYKTVDIEIKVNIKSMIVGEREEKFFSGFSTSKRVVNVLNALYPFTYVSVLKHAIT